MRKFKYKVGQIFDTGDKLVPHEAATKAVLNGSWFIKTIGVRTVFFAPYRYEDKHNEVNQITFMLDIEDDYLVKAGVLMFNVIETAKNFKKLNKDL